ncbi:hypothetical protein BX666DRAFT_1836895, partial [Dichotomocladium elegans]
HDLAVRPSYEWQPDVRFSSLMPTLEQPLFSNTLADDVRKAIIERYPPIQGLCYAPPATVPQEEHLFKPSQKADDAMLRQLQYTISGILRPLDVLGHAILA